MVIVPTNNETNASDYENNPYNLTAKKNLNAANMRSAINTKQSALPIGSIIMYNGANWEDNKTLPGWYACCQKQEGSQMVDKKIKVKIDGNEVEVTVPNLVNKFIRGTGASGNIGDAQNPGTVTLKLENLPAHSHTFHSHTPSSIQASGSGIQRSVPTYYYADNLSTGNNGGNGSAEGDPFEVIPRYYALIYIIRLF